MAYSYQLGYVEERTAINGSVIGRWRPVTVEVDIPTLAELQARVKQDTGEVPDWLLSCSPDEYLGVEHDYQVKGEWFVACIEGSEPHVLPSREEREEPLAKD